jgi:hypothetical protein
MLDQFDWVCELQVQVASCVRESFKQAALGRQAPAMMMVMMSADVPCDCTACSAEPILAFAPPREGSLVTTLRKDDDQSAGLVRDIR